MQAERIARGTEVTIVDTEGREFVVGARVTADEGEGVVTDVFTAAGQQWVRAEFRPKPNQTVSRPYPAEPLGAAGSFQVSELLVAHAERDGDQS